jgi:hypothetical protein
LPRDGVALAGIKLQGHKPGGHVHALEALEQPGQGPLGALE